MMKKLLGWAMATMLLGACVPVPPEPSLLLVHGPAEAAGVTPTWCYSTLAEPDCFTQRSPDANERLIGAYLPVEPSPAPEVEPE
jgi:hypothetical protein